MPSRFTPLIACPLLLCLLVSGCQSDPVASDSTSQPTQPQQPAEPIAVQPAGANATPPAAPEQPATRAKTNPPAPAPTGPQEPRYAQVDWPHLKIDLNNKIIEIAGFSGINEGWLEQIICLAGTRTHESVLVTAAKPSHIHAALLLIGLEPGRPGSWRIDPEDPQGMKWIVQPPQGAAVSITVEWTDQAGERRETPVREWVRDFHTGKTLPEGPWIFGGSLMKPDYTGKVVYVADRSGSIAGLVTFGDELLGWSEVLPDQEAVMAPEWQANTAAMPPPLTPVTIRLRPASSPR